MECVVAHKVSNEIRTKGLGYYLANLRRVYHDEGDGDLTVTFEVTDMMAEVNVNQVEDNLERILEASCPTGLQVALIDKSDGCQGHGDMGCIHWMKFDYVAPTWFK